MTEQLTSLMNDSKIEISFDQATPNCATVIVKGEDHTMGNCIRYILLKNKEVDFGGYSIPHPTDNLVNFRIQTQAVCPKCNTIAYPPNCKECSTPVKEPPAHQVFAAGLTQLEEIGQHVLSVFQTAVENQMIED